MPAFYLPEGKSISLEEDYLVPLGLGWCTITDGILYSDQPLSPEHMERIAAEGFTRADTHWYTVEPEPQYEQHHEVVRAFGQRPATTIPPQRDSEGKLRLAFVKALEQDNIQKLSDLGLKATAVEAPAKLDVYTI